MRRTFAALAVLGVVAAIAAAPANGQQERWDARDLQVAGGGGGKEFRLRNDSGSTLILQCLRQAVGAGFEFAEPIEPTQQVTVRGVPGQQRNVAVQPVGDRVLRIASGRGRDFVLRMLSGAANLSVRASGQREWFEVFGSDTIVSECFLQQQGRDNSLDLDPGSIVATVPLSSGGLAPLR